MSFRQYISGFPKKVKDKLSKVWNKMGEERPNVVSEGFEHPALPLQSEPAIVAGGKTEDTEVGAGKASPRPDDSLPVSRSAVEIGYDQEKSDDEAGGGEISRKDLHPHPHVQIESGSSRERREAERSQDQELDSST